MNDQEKKCLQATVNLWNELTELDFKHEEGGSPNDMNEIQFHMHAIQNYLFARAGLRDYRKNSTHV